MIKNFFWSKTEKRVRSGWRILIQIVMISTPLSIIAYLGVYSSGQLAITRVMITALPITIISVLLLGQYIDKRKFSDYGITLTKRNGGQSMVLGY